MNKKVNSQTYENSQKDFIHKINVKMLMDNELGFMNSIFYLSPLFHNSLFFNKLQKNDNKKESKKKGSYPQRP